MNRDNRPVSMYDPMRFDSVPHGWTKEQQKAGGRVRAMTAKRHALGFYLPGNVDSVSLPDDYIHGRAGGQSRAIKAPRDARGRFVKGDSK